ncbi:hypothetical protein MASR2M15_18590 [Anaerolineales bacterium]
MAENTMYAVDSLCANEFAVELDGKPASGIFSISGLVTYQTDDQGKVISVPFRLAKMVQRNANNAFNKWIRETTGKRSDTDRPRRDLAIVAIDDGVEIRRWEVKGAWIQSIAYSQFNSASFEMMEEILSISYEDIEETWAASHDLE